MAFRFVLLSVLVLGGCYDLSSLSKNYRADSDMSGADLSNADLVTPPSPDLAGADLSGADLSIVDLAVGDLVGGTDDLPVMTLADLAPTPDLVVLADLAPELDMVKLEICNAIDDNSNGQIDEGCPKSFLTSLPDEKTMVGSTSAGTAYAANDLCGAGKVAVGLRIHANASQCNISLQVVCAPYSLGKKTSVNPFEYSLVVGTSLTYGAAHGTAGTITAPNTAPSTTLTCPASEVMRGFTMRSRSMGAYGMTVLCQGATIDNEDGTYKLRFSATGSSTLDSPYTGACGSTSMATSQCDANQMMVGLNGRGEALVNALAAVCVGINVTDQ